MTAPLLSLQGLAMDFDGKTALSVPHLDIHSETITGLAGPNGSGKSTLLNVLGLIVPPSRGTVRFQGRPVEPFSARARHRICLLTQEPYLLNRSVFDNLAYGLVIRRDTANLKKRVAEALDAVGLAPETFASRHAHRLSGGEARRVALAARLIVKPDVLLLDEPTSNVDEKSSHMIRSAVLMAREKQNTTLVVSSHDRDWLDSICDRVLTLVEGRIYDQGRLNMLYGPWEKQSETVYIRKAAAGIAPIVVPPPPHPMAVAILPARRLFFVPMGEAVPDGVLSFACRVAGLSLSAKTSDLQVSLSHEGSLLWAESASPGARHLMPGEWVRAFYDPADVMFDGFEKRPISA
jgi:tungstate transport system ATP-binding protein